MRLILASTSPRRRSLLEEAGYAHEAMPPGFDDATLHWDRATPPDQYTADLALLKARAVIDRLGGLPADTIVLAADTIVVKNGSVLGQPMTSEQALDTLKMLVDGSHVVMTGVAVFGPGLTRFTDHADVQVGLIGEPVLRAYVDSGQWKGKAGAYNLFERLEAGWPITYRGDPATIMGLPIKRLRPILDGMLARDKGGAS